MNAATVSVPRAHREIKLTEKDKARFWAKVDKSGGPDTCWPWTACKNATGYGLIGINGKMHKAHRIAWTLANGQIPHDNSAHGICACHRCDNPSCCNPAHLFLGTQGMNMKDRDVKGRTASGDAHYSRLRPECMARGDANGARLHPERIPRGESHYSRKHPERMARGEQHGNSKLTADQVLEIRAIHAAGATTRKAIAMKFGVHYALIGYIIRRKIWQHV